MPTVPLMPELTFRVCPAATWKTPSVPPKARIGTERAELVPVPMARMPPLVTVKVVGDTPARPPRLTAPDALLINFTALTV